MRGSSIVLLCLLAGCGSGSKGVPDLAGQVQEGHVESVPLFPAEDVQLQESLRSLHEYLVMRISGYAERSKLEKIEMLVMLMTDPGFTATMNPDPRLTRALELRPESVAGQPWDYWAAIAVGLKIGGDSPQERDMVREQFGLNALPADDPQSQSLLSAFDFLRADVSQ